MGRFKVGDRVKHVNGVTYTLTDGPDDGGVYAARNEAGFIATVFSHHLAPVPRPDPRDAVVEAAVAWAAGWDASVEHRPTVLNPLRPIYDAVQAWKAAQ